MFSRLARHLHLYCRSVLSHLSQSAKRPSGCPPALDALQKAAALNADTVPALSADARLSVAFLWVPLLPTQ